MTIDFQALPKRVADLQNHLTGIINEKTSSPFWNEVSIEIERMGVRAAMGVKGQFNSFDKSQPG